MRDDPNLAQNLAIGGTINASTTETYSVVAGDLAHGVLLLCDHAGNAFPEGYGTLGLPEPELKRHIAYDIGAAAVTRHMAAALGAPAILSHYSRLLIDLNRGADDPTLIMRISDGAVVPGNRHLDVAERENRIRLYYRPYHEAVDALLDRGLAIGIPPVVVSIHSFTDNWRGTPRPWHTGILWDKDDRLALPLIKTLSEEAGLVVGDNEPYDGKLKGDCLWQHGTQRGLAHAIIEVRQDLIGKAGGQREWGDRLSRAVRSILAEPASKPSLHRVEHFGSHTDDNQRVKRR